MRDTRLRVFRFLTSSSNRIRITEENSVGLLPMFLPFSHDNSKDISTGGETFYY